MSSEGFEPVHTHPVMAFGNPKEWIQILERIEQLDIEIIVPGHGEVCSIHELHEVKRYLTHIISLVEETFNTQAAVPPEGGTFY